MPSNTGENSKMSKEGCCICGIRRSSEGFTSSERFSKSGQLKKCFRLSKSRYGVLCSDCLTVFKKWQRMNHVARQSKDLSSLVDSKLHGRKRDPSSLSKARRKSSSDTKTSKSQSANDSSARRKTIGDTTKPAGFLQKRARVVKENKHDQTENIATSSKTMLKTALKEVAKQPKESVRNANKVRQIVAEEIGEHEAVKEDDKENPNKSLQLDEVMDVEVSVSNSGEVDHTKCAKCIKNAMTMLKRRHARCDEENIADVIFQKYGIAKETVAKHLKICEEESEIARHPSRPSTFVFPSFSYTKKKDETNSEPKLNLTSSVSKQNSTTSTEQTDKTQEAKTGTSSNSTEETTDNSKTIKEEHIGKSKDVDMSPPLTQPVADLPITVAPVEDMLSDEDERQEEDDEVFGSPAEVGFETPSTSPEPGETASSFNTEPCKPVEGKQYVSTSTQTAFLFPALTSPQANENKLPFIDLSTWRQEEICCGTIFRGPNGEVLVDPKWLRPFCSICSRSAQPPTPIEKTQPESISMFDEKLATLCS